MSNFLKLTTLVLFCATLLSCGGDEEVNPPTEITLESIANGEGIMVVSGNVEKTVEGVIGLASTGSAQSDENTLNVVSYVFSNEPDGASISVYWPASEGEEMPAGAYEVGFLDASIDNNSTPSGRFVEVFVSVNEAGYSASSLTTGSATISNVSANYDMDLTFTARNLDAFSEDDPIDVSGGMKYRN